MATTVAVIGGGISGLIAAKTLNEAGVEVTVLEASAQLGGVLRPLEVNEILVDAGADSFATRNQATMTVITELGLQDQLIHPQAQAWIQYPGTPAREHARKLPSTGMLGIPADLHEAQITEVLGLSATVIARKDKLINPKSLLKKQPLSLAELVTARMGKAVLETLVRPVVAGVYSAQPEDLDADLALPGIREKMRETGSLAKAVTVLRSKAPAGSTVGSLRGGMHTLVTALREYLQQRGVQICLDTEATQLHHDPETAWSVQYSTQHQESGHKTKHKLSAGYDGVVLAVPEAAARGLLSTIEAPGARLTPLGEALEQAGAVEQNQVTLVTLVLDAPELDEAPRGSGVIVAAGVEVAAKALTHASAKWQWLGDEAGPGTHVLRLSYGRSGEDLRSRSDQQWLETAVHDASVLMDVPLDIADVLDFAVTEHTGAQPSARLGHAQREAQLRKALTQVPALTLCGAWLAGPGLARVIPDAKQAATLLAAQLGVRSGVEEVYEL